MRPVKFARTLFPPSGSPATVPGSPRRWADLLSTGLPLPPVSPEVDALLQDLFERDRMPATWRDCLAVLSWCDVHGESNVLQALLDRCAPEDTHLEIDATQFRIGRQLLRLLLAKLSSTQDGQPTALTVKHVILDETTARQLAAFVEGSSTLEDFSLQDCVEQSPRTAILVFDAAAANPGLRHLRVDFGPVAPDRIMEGSLISLFACHHLTTLELDGVGISRDLAIRIANEMKKPGCALEKLALRDFSRFAGEGDDKAAEIVIEAVTAHPSLALHTLEISEVRPGNGYSRAVCDLLQADCGVTHLVLSDTGLPAGSGGPLGKALAKNTSLVALDLSYNLLMDVGDLVQALHGNTSLKHLGLQGTGLDDSAGPCLAALLCNSGLESLDLSSNSLRRNGVEPIFVALACNTHLTGLELKVNAIAGLSEPAIAGLSRNRSLARLDLMGNFIFESSPGALLAACDGNRMDLDLSFNVLKDHQAGEFANALADSSGIVKLRMNHCRFDEGPLLDHLAACIEKNHTLTELEYVDPHWPVEPLAMDDRRRKVDWILDRNARIRDGIDDYFKSFAVRLEVPLPPELGPLIREHLEHGNDGAQAMSALRRALKPSGARVAFVDPAARRPDPMDAPRPAPLLTSS